LPYVRALADSRPHALEWRVDPAAAGLTWRYRLGCIKVLSIQLVLLTMGLLGLSLTGLGIDYIRYQVQGGPFPSASSAWPCPTTGPRCR